LLNIVFEKRMPSNISELEQYMVEEWENIPDALILISITSMPRRIQACIEAEGGHTRY